MKIVDTLRIQPTTNYLHNKAIQASHLLTKFKKECATLWNLVSRTKEEGYTRRRTQEWRVDGAESLKVSIFIS